MAEEEKKEETKDESPEEVTTEETPSEADATEGGSTEEIEVPEQFKALVEQVEKMSVLELHELVKVLEKKFGVSAQAVAVAGTAGGAEEGEEEKDEFAISLKDAGGQKIAVIKVVKEVLGLGLKEAKDLVDGAPAVLKEGVKKEAAEELKGRLEEVGATVELT